jgi:hypothetical protein
MFYTYLWLREDGTPYYVGKGSGRRAYSKRGHRCSPPPKGRIIFYIAKDEADALETEIALIWYYGRKNLGTGCLRNFTDGGEGVSGYKHTEEAKRNMGHGFSEETLHKMSEAKKGKPLTDKHKQNLREAQKGRLPITEATRDKHRIAASAREAKKHQNILASKNLTHEQHFLISALRDVVRHREYAVAWNKANPEKVKAKNDRRPRKGLRVKA